MKRAMVLGGTGFIGYHICRELLDNGYTVRVLARPGGNRLQLDGLAVEIVDGNIDENSPEELAAAFRDCNYLIHAAAYYPVYSLNPSAHTKRGILQITTILDAAEMANVERFVYVSSPTAVGRYVDGRPEDENAPYPARRNRAAYCRVKRVMQDKVLERTKRLNAVVAAPTGVFGEMDRKPTTGRTILAVASGRVPFSLAGRLNAVDVHDVASGVRLVLEKGITGRLYVLGGENLTFGELLTRMAVIAGMKPPRASLSPDLLWPMAALSELIGRLLGMRVPFFPMVSVHFAQYGEYVSSEVARTELGYLPHPVEPALRRAYNWFVENGYIRPKSR